MWIHSTMLWLTDETRFMVWWSSAEPIVPVFNEWVYLWWRWSLFFNVFSVNAAWQVKLAILWVSELPGRLDPDRGSVGPDPFAVSGVTLNLYQNDTDIGQKRKDAASGSEFDFVLLIPVFSRFPVTRNAVQFWTRCFQSVHGVKPCLICHHV